MNIILSSIKRGLRDKNTVLSNIFLALLLPYIFSIIFSFEGGKEDINLAIVGNTKSSIINSYCEALEKFDDNNSKINIDYKIYSENEFDKNNLPKSNSLIVNIDEKDKKVNVGESSDISMGQESVKKLTEEFFNSISVYESLNKENYTPTNVTNIIKNEKYNVSEKSKSILDDMEYGEYFALVMLEMAILVGSIHAFKNTFYIKEKLGNRVKISPAKVSSLLSLELVGSFFLIFSQGLVMLGAAVIFYGVNVNINNILPILSIIGLLSLFAVCLGIFTTALGNKKNSGDNICSFIVTVLALASGQLMPQMSDSFDKISLIKLNPFLWISKELNNLVAYNSSENLLMTVVITLTASLILMVISTILLKRKVVR
ncbi:ABC transporter permease [Terrisporobacter glycolicus]|uniref:ABC transporter permease n=1 Tax=Terrisporobacter glycolicus TaxID=36841 RepID=UPI000CDEB16C